MFIDVGLKVDKEYQKNQHLYRTISLKLSELTGISTKIIEKEIKHYLTCREDKRNQKTYFKNFFIWYAFIVTAILLNIFSIKNKQSDKCNIIFDLASKSFYNRFYLKLISKLPKEYIIKFDKVVPKKFFILATIGSYVNLYRSFFIFSSLQKYSSLVNINLILFSIRLFLSISRYHVVNCNMNSYIYCSALDNSFHPIKYSIFKKYHDHIIILQNSTKLFDDPVIGKYFLSCDYFFSFGEIYKENFHALDYKHFFPVGNISLENVDESIEKDMYDYIMVEQTQITSIHFDEDLYLKLLQNYIEFANKYCHYKCGYRIRPNRNVLMSKEKYKNVICNIDKLLEKSRLKINAEDNYDDIFSSDVVFGYNSGLILESLAFDKKVFKCDCGKGEQLDQFEDSLLILDSFDFTAFENKMLTIKELDFFQDGYEFYKRKYMAFNYNRLPSDIIVSEIKKINT